LQYLVGDINDKHKQFYKSM